MALDSDDQETRNHANAHLCARAALAEAAQSPPEGWPTNEMIEAGRKAAASHGPLLGNGQSLWHIFRDMLAASRTKPSDPVCERCEGSGEALVMEGGGPDTYELLVSCPECKGTGEPKAAQPVQPSDPWLPIETAPKDGTRVLLRGNDDRHADGYWQERDVYTGPAYWVWPYVKCEPTHWMPLPPAPQPKD